MSQMPDYYAVLDVAPSASFDEIKKSFRKKAHQYHPDKHQDSQDGHAAFLQLKEAYVILSNPKERQAYHFKKFHETLRLEETNFDIVLHELQELSKLLKTIGHDRIDFDLLFFQLKTIIPHDTQFLSNPKTMASIFVSSLIECFDFLNYTLLIRLKESRIELFEQLNSELLNKYFRKRKMQSYFEQLKLLIAFLIAVSICLWLIRSTK